MKKYKVYFFDFDGTLVDSHDSLVEVFEGAYGSVGVKVPEGYVLRLMRIPLYQGYHELNGPTDEESIKIFSDNIISLLNEERVLKLTKSYVDTIPNLMRLKSEGALLGIVTSNNRKHVNDVLGFLNIDPNLFEIIVGNEETKKHKPNPDPIYKAMELLNITNKDDVCYVGDALDDKKTAINAGVTPILVDRDRIYAKEDGIVIHDLNEL